ncbi:hypothetical protein Drose_21495 [Dactylosporangium roseum]|uniref:Uncharacterized protein n=1 Tax=Dactylosporangium roseum TaxID=47989 RepID=A0ABY5YX63_9ACTN|nr:hypothetical protein [Dactylosporangium roseum]UWZ33847.1 hypothetical protein Drose_21495 [Dactylosporangium roseum]
MTVLPSPHPAAYLVPGGHRHVVITSGALRHPLPGLTARALGVAATLPPAVPVALAVLDLH